MYVNYMIIVLFPAKGVESSMRVEIMSVFCSSPYF